MILQQTIKTLNYHASDEPRFEWLKYVQYIGIEIREKDVYNFGVTEESIDTRQPNTNIKDDIYNINIQYYYNSGNHS